MPTPSDVFTTRFDATPKREEEGRFLSKQSLVLQTFTTHPESCGTTQVGALQ